VVLSEKQVLAWTAPWRGEEKLHRAWQSLQRNDTEKALGLAAQIRQEHPDDAGLLMRVSILQAKGGDLPGAGATIDRAAERNPWDYRPHVLAARLFFAGGDVEASAAAWTEAFYRQAPTALLPEAMKAQALGLWWVSALVDHSPVYSFTLAILLSEEDPKAARLAMDQAAYLAPDYYGHRAFHAELMRRSGDLRGAEAFLQEALFLQPEGSSLWQSLSRLRASQERWMEARDAMLKAAGFHRVLRAQALMAIEKADGPGSVQVQYETWKRRGPVGDGVSYRAALARYRASDPLGCVLILEEANLLVSQTYGERAETLMARCRW
jgi:predicted Zn-dependent protease